MPHGNKTYLGILEPEDGGRAGIWTVYDPKTEKLPDKSGSLDSGRRNVPSNYAAEDGSFTQRQLSAVESDKKINSQNKRVNGAVLLAGAGAALAYPWSANAPGCVNLEPGPGTPLADMAAEPGESHK